MSDFCPRQIEAWDTEPPLLPLFSLRRTYDGLKAGVGPGCPELRSQGGSLTEFSSWKGWKRNNMVSIFHSLSFWVEKYFMKIEI